MSSYFSTLSANEKEECILGYKRFVIYTLKDEKGYQVILNSELNQDDANKDAGWDLLVSKTEIKRSPRDGFCSDSPLIAVYILSSLESLEPAHINKLNDLKFVDNRWIVVDEDFTKGKTEQATQVESNSVSIYGTSDLMDLEYLTSELKLKAEKRLEDLQKEILLLENLFKPTIGRLRSRGRSARSLPN